MLVDALPINLLQLNCNISGAHSDLLWVRVNEIPHQVIPLIKVNSSLDNLLAEEGRVRAPVFAIYLDEIFEVIVLEYSIIELRDLIA